MTNNNHLVPWFTHGAADPDPVRSTRFLLDLDPGSDLQQKEIKTLRKNRECKKEYQNTQKTKRARKKMRAQRRTRVPVCKKE